MVDTVNLNNPNPSISEDKNYYSLVGLDKSVKWQSLDSVNSMIDTYFGYQVYNDKFTS